VRHEFVKSKALMVRREGNKARRFLEVAAYAEGRQQGIIWIPKGRAGWGWRRFAGEMRQILVFQATFSGSLKSEVPSQAGKHIQDGRSFVEVL
jgi:hypothetical protein